MKKNLKTIAQVIGATDLDASADGGVFLTEAQHEALTTRLEADATAITGHAGVLQTALDNLKAANLKVTSAESALTEANGKLDTANTALTAAQGKITTIETAVAEKDTEIAELTEDKKELNAKISGKPYTRVKGTGPTPPVKTTKVYKSVEAASKQVD